MRNTAIEMYLVFTLIITLPPLGYGADILTPDAYELGASGWVGYSGGHLQEAIYQTPVETISGGGDLFIHWLPVDLGPLTIGVRGTLLEMNYMLLEYIRVHQLDFNADFYTSVDLFSLITLYGFAGATFNNLNIKDRETKEDVAELGKGFRYGGGAKVELTFADDKSIRIGPEFSMGHIMYYLIIYHYWRVNIGVDVILESNRGNR